MACHQAQIGQTDGLGQNGDGAQVGGQVVERAGAVMHPDARQPIGQFLARPGDAVGGHLRAFDRTHAQQRFGIHPQHIGRNQPGDPVGQTWGGQGQGHHDLRLASPWFPSG